MWCGVKRSEKVMAVGKCSWISDLDPILRYVQTERSLFQEFAEKSTMQGSEGCFLF